MTKSYKKAEKHGEAHLLHRANWLRAAVLGANDGILSIASIMTGMAAGEVSHQTILLAGLAALMAGATSMATGEYVSVSSQSDVEAADLAREKHELEHNTKFELAELTQIYVSRGLDFPLAKQVAAQLMAHDALGAHARDELGISDVMSANPLQAALASAASFTAGGILPMAVAFFAPQVILMKAIIVSTLLSLTLLGALGAKAGGVKIVKPMFRVLLWGTISLALTTAVGIFFKVTP